MDKYIASKPTLFKIYIIYNTIIYCNENRGWDLIINSLSEIALKQS